MTNAEIGAMFKRGNLIRAYVQPHGGLRSAFWFEHSPSNIANFIIKHRYAQEIILTDEADTFILNTIGEFIDRCPDQKLLRNILPHLIPMQMGQAVPQNFPIATDEEVDAYFEAQDAVELDT